MSIVAPLLHVSHSDSMRHMNCERSLAMLHNDKITASWLETQKEMPIFNLHRQLINLVMALLARSLQSQFTLKPVAVWISQATSHLY